MLCISTRRLTMTLNWAQICRFPHFCTKHDEE